MGALVVLAARVASAQPAGVEIHGFASEGGFVSTANDYIGASSRGTLELFEAGLNISTEVADRLRVGMQLYGRDVGTFRDLPPRLDWAFLDYHWQDWLGLRAGIIKMPYGLYNEYEDVDTARLSILMPQSVYPIRNRSALLAQTGFELYGTHSLGDAGGLDYQAWFGTLDIPANALIVNGATLDAIDTRYITGAQVFWRTPLEGLRVGVTVLRGSIDFHLTLPQPTVDALIMAGAVPPDFDGKVLIEQRPDWFWIGSAEYAHDDWLIAAEYSRWHKHQESSLSDLLPTFDENNERLYAMLTRRVSPLLEVGGYYSVFEADINDRFGHNTAKFAKPYFAFQRDLAATVRFDINDHWLWKLEGHFIDGAADLDLVAQPNPERYWGLFLVKTTVTF